MHMSSLNMSHDGSFATRCIVTMNARPCVVTMVRHLLNNFLFQSFYLILFQVFKFSYKIRNHYTGDKLQDIIILSDLTSQRHYYEGLVSISCSVTIESILGAAKFVALLAVISCASYMLHLNVVLHICCVLACMSTIRALPNPRGVLEHLGT
eukprot:TRINITY_DN32414_c0_g1_i1.p1 TRINITY_DN32414_c0_g1~~TRINITY_DN32414_c0_g1_i1.p1  ORF type:complete len:152 (-),score=9.70 TRINITY_DN32414_c0_g1_i1:269-724(-)